MNAIPIHERDHSVLLAEALRLEKEGKFVALIQPGSRNEFRFLDSRGSELSTLPVSGDLDGVMIGEIWHEFQDVREAHYAQAWDAWGAQMRSLKEDGETFPLDCQKDMWVEFYQNFPVAPKNDGWDVKMPEALLRKRLQPEPSESLA